MKVRFGFCICSNQVFGNYWNNAAYKTSILVDATQLDGGEKEKDLKAVAWRQLLTENNLLDELPKYHFFVVYGVLIDNNYFESEKDIFAPTSVEEAASYLKFLTN